MSASVIVSRSCAKKKNDNYNDRNDSVVSFTPQVSLDNWFHFQKKIKKRKKRGQYLCISAACVSVKPCSREIRLHTERAASNRFASIYVSRYLRASQLQRYSQSLDKRIPAERLTKGVRPGATGCPALLCPALVSLGCETMECIP